MVGGSRFFGREADVARLTELAAAHAVVTVTGPGGVGKTRLVEEALASLPGAEGDRVHVAHLADVDAGAGPDAVAARLGVSTAEAVALRIGDDPALLVLDNCEHVLAGAAALVNVVVTCAPTATIVATSREPLGVPGEVVLVLDPLAAEGAAELFLDRAAAAGATWPRTDEALAAVADVCRRVDGLPLAIELAASRTRSLTPSELLGLLDERLDVLKARDAGRPERHRSVRAAVDVSVDLLDDRTRCFFHALGVLHGSFDLDLAHAVAGPEPDDRLATVDLVGELVARSLVAVEATPTRTRYRLLEVVREHAADSLREAGGWDEANERLTDVMAAEADRVVVDGVRGWSAELIGSIIANLGNLAAAIDWCVAHDDGPERANRLFLPMFAAVHQGRAAEVRPLGERILDRWPDHPAPLRAEMLAVLATAHALASTSERAVELAGAALADPGVTAIGRVVGRRAMLLAAMGVGDVVTGSDQARQARAEAEAAGLAPFVRELTAFEAGLLDAVGRRDEAAVLADQALADSLAAGDEITELWARLIVATVAMRSGRLADARVAIDRAIATSGSLDDAWWGGALFRSQARLASYEASATAITDGWEASRDLWRGAIQRAARHGDLPELALSLRAAAVVAARAGRLAVAHALLDAVPQTGDVTVLPELFEEERAALEASRPERPPGRRTLVEALRLALAAIDDGAAEPAAPTPAPGPVERRPQLRFEGDVWSITFAGTTVRVRDAKGLRDIAALLGRPGEEVHCLELMGGARVDDGAGPALDDRARREYQARILELQEEVDSARADNDSGRADKAEHELDLLVQQLSEAFGIGGRARATGSSAERARTAVTYRIRASIRKLAEVHPDLGRHLTNAVRTGTWCAYRPETDVDWEVLTT